MRTGVFREPGLELIGVIFLVLLFWQSEAVGVADLVHNSSGYTGSCSSPIFCNEKLLAIVDASEMFKDPKDFVDMWLVEDPTIALVTFNEKVLPKASKGENYEKELKMWISLFFRNADRAYVTSVPEEWSTTPPYLNKIKDEDLKKWAKYLQLMWTGLVKKTRADTYIFPERFSLIYLPNPVVLSGGRYREWYYWDSYWIVLALLKSGLTKTAKGVMENFVALVEEFGHVPNGGRTYYLRRSQPPFLIPMANAYMEHMKKAMEANPNKTETPTFIYDYINAMGDEFDFWLKKRSVNITLDNGEVVAMFAYGANSTGPRPEEFTDDQRAAVGMNDEAKRDFYMNIKTTCESGWDFSSRWIMNDDGSMPNPQAGEVSLPWSKMKPKQIIPVDLNALMCYNARILGETHAQLSEKGKDDPDASKYFQLSKKIRQNIERLLYDPNTGSWFDYDYVNKKKRKHFYASNAWPLWLDCYGPDENKTILGLKFLDYMESQNATEWPGGVPASGMAGTGFAWDFPNSYGPLTHSLVMALDSVDHPRTKKAGLELAQRWLDAAYLAFRKTQGLYHSYNVTSPSDVGEEEDGYAWTLAVAVEFLNKFGDKLVAASSSVSLVPIEKPGDTSTTLLRLLVVATTLAGLRMLISPF